MYASLEIYTFEITEKREVFIPKYGQYTFEISLDLQLDFPDSTKK